MQTSYEEIFSVATDNDYTPAKTQTWRECLCEKSHKTVEKKISCALSYYHSNGENKTKSVVKYWSDSATNEWAVIKKLYSGSYYNSHNGSRRNDGYFTYHIRGFSSQRDALNYYHLLKTTPCYDCEGERNNHGIATTDCPNVLPIVVRIVL